jgi:dTDP-glucose 4,6-dehydratase
MDRKLNRAEGSSKKLITFVKDRPGHDLRYAIDSSKVKKDIGWEPTVSFEEGLERTVDWYLANSGWLNNVISGEYEKYYNSMYSGR